MSKVCVIGAGIAGLVTARTMLAKGHDVTVLEQRRHLGGVWDPDFSYPEVGTQTNGRQYSFSEFPMPASYPEWPNGAQVYDYLNEYAKRFGVFEHIAFEMTVKHLAFDEGAGQWTVTVGDGSKTEDLTFDYVAICTGVFNRPNIPDLPGAEAFVERGGVIAHTSQFTDADLIDDKQVVVVGFQKSATDVVGVAIKRAASTTLVYRRAMWKTPKFFLNKINVKYLFYSRAVEAMIEPIDPTALERILHRIGRPITWGFWRVVERLLARQLGLHEAGLMPDHPLDTQISCALSVAPDGYYDSIRSRDMTAKKGQVVAFEDGGVRLDTGEHLPADVVIFGTGWVQSLPFLDAETLSKVVDHEGNFRLYRNIVSPEIPQLGFVGYNGSLFCQLTSEVAAAWLAHLWDGGITLPSLREMNAQVEHRIDWMRRNRPADLRSFKNSCVAPFEYHYWDDLLRDMGLPTTVSQNWVRETFKPLNPSDYAELLAPVRTPSEVES